ncbi:MAG: hypothetical protein ACD_45C00683G0005 [uncultured bacterium]|nr:MAG: hypothetical protein ACD_45C00683G0005 [uncultured bacterium]
MFDADRPIFTKNQDQLGRSGFAKYLARCMLDHKNPESLVIGLYGGWGTGKTSIINLILEELHIAASNMFDEEKPIILNFSPWSYSGQNQLIYNFFRRLSSEIRRSAAYVEHAEKIIHLLELYVSFFTHLPVPKTLRPKQSMLASLIKPSVAQEAAYGWESGRDLTHIKAELNTLLSQQKHKIIIFIDNIARMEDQEIKQIFQIVKSMGDYMNTVYVLAIDKEHIIRAMNNLYDNDGENYLEKIVQLPFKIPEISKENVENILLDRLKQVVDMVPEDMWDKKYWCDIYYSTLKYFFHNCRDITHYVNTLSFSYPRVKELVNPIDFFAITAIHVFSPSVFIGIRDNKDVFTDLVNPVFAHDEKKLADDKIRCDEILNRTEHISREHLQQLLIFLFPRLRHIYKNDMPFYHSEELARRNRRVCSAEFFDAYFQLSVAADYMPKAEFHAILSLAHNPKEFTEAVLCLNKDERALYFLDQLDSNAINKIPTNYIKNVVNTLIDCADLFPEGVSSPLKVNTPMRVHRILHQLFRRFSHSTERFALLQDAAKNTTLSLYSLVHELNLQNEERLAAEDTLIPTDQHDFTAAQIEILQKCVVEKIVYWAKMKRLAEHPKLLEILYAWKNWGNERECRDFVGQMVQEDRGLIAFLCVALREPIHQTITKLTQTPAWEESLRVIEDFISVKILEPHAKMLFEDLAFETLREQEQLAILIFLNLVHANTIKIIPQTTPP